MKHPVKEIQCGNTVFRQVDLTFPAWRIIFDATTEIINLPPDHRLEKALKLLYQANKLVGDYADSLEDKP